MATHAKNVLAWGLRGRAVILCSLAATLFSTAARTSPTDFAVKNAGTLHLDVPSAWRYLKGSSNPPHLAEFSLPDGTGFVRFTIVSHPDRERGFTPEDLYKGTVLAWEAAKRDASDKKVKMSRISGRGNRGYYLSFWTTHPEKPGFNFHAQGAVIVERLSLNFVAELRSPDDQIVESLFHISKTASLAPITTYELSLPDAKWQLLVGVRGFTIENDATQTHLQAISRKAGVVMSAFLESGHPGASAVSCRDYYVAKLSDSPVLMSETREFEQGQMALHEYRIEEFQGVRVRQLNIHGYLAHSDVCAELHVSKVDFHERERAQLLQILQSAKVVERE